MWQKQPSTSSFRESIKALEADIQHANGLAAGLPRDYCGDSIQMRLSYSPFAPFLSFLIEWMDCRCTDSIPSYLGLVQIIIYQVYVDGMPTMSSKERQASLREFYAVIYPMLRQLEAQFILIEDDNKKRSQAVDVSSRKWAEDKRGFGDKDIDKEDECGICMDSFNMMVLPSCGHSMCINCFRDWNGRSLSCPFCRDSLKRVGSRDLWVLTSGNDVVDAVTLAKENLRSFYLYIESLPYTTPETRVIVFDYMMF
ncbi:E3 ubiquitin-protein ligase AIRP2-like [Syzygium oleosum]|uniref:E3 ubiquitin-protein ligase AIRP2-like n=1 Tax=Syzygium oleosum TaxID=219896 RepID=UPI0011D2AB5B|nr:E3 ubiquitin-protein ligase AIRP2-like [Syzygium oleosum]